MFDGAACRSSESFYILNFSVRATPIFTKLMTWTESKISFRNYYSSAILYLLRNAMGQARRGWMFSFGPSVFLCFCASQNNTHNGEGIKPIRDNLTERLISHAFFQRKNADKGKSYEPMAYLLALRHY